MVTHELNITGMSCGHCVKSVREAILHVPGVTRADVTIGHAHVETEPDVLREAIVAAIAVADYVAS